jgi:hypothetical protein
MEPLSEAELRAAAQIAARLRTLDPILACDGFARAIRMWTGRLLCAGWPMADAAQRGLRFGDAIIDAVGPRRARRGDTVH